MNNISKLVKMSIDKGLDFNVLIKKYNDKVYDYIVRDNKNGKEVNYFKPEDQYQRAYNVIKRAYLKLEKSEEVEKYE